MKSFFTSVGAVILASALFFSCASTKIDYQALASENTPENSVVVVLIGADWFRDMNYVQINPSCPHDKFVFKSSFRVTPPLKPGSVYISALNEKDFDFFDFPGVNTEQYNVMNNPKPASQYGQKIYAPKKPGLYFTYYNENPSAYYENPLEIKKIYDEYKITSVFNRQMRETKSASKVYAGTAWESVFNKAFEELSK